MNRRSILKLGLFSSIVSIVKFSNLHSQAINAETSIIRPNKLKRGDNVGIIAPATSVTSPDDIYRVEEILNYLQLKGLFSKNILNPEGYKTKSKRIRANDFNEAFANKDLKAVFCIRGGYGSMGILDMIDYNLVKKNPKIFIGYSDITAIHLALQKFTGLSTIHGPMMLSDFQSSSMDFLEKLLFTNEPLGRIENPNGDKIRDQFPIRIIKEGNATGKLTGGNLSLITSLIGTRYEIDTKDKILFLEDVGEEPYRIDRMLTQLNLAGKFENVKGVIFGKCQDCVQKTTPSVWDYSLGEVLDDQFTDFKFPIMYGHLIGHTSVQYSLPYGLSAKIDTNDKSIEILESFCV